MNYLLDTHVIIWYLENEPDLSSEMRDEINSDANSVYICTASLWEIAIKVNVGKLKLKSGFDEFLNDIESSKFDVLQVEDQQLRVLAKLPLLHRDPFDRMIISTAIAEGLTVITADEAVRKYDVSWAW